MECACRRRKRPHRKRRKSPTEIDNYLCALMCVLRVCVLRVYVVFLGWLLRSQVVSHINTRNNAFQVFAAST